jgi:phage terminase large subunit
MSVMATDKKNKSRPEDKNNHTYDAMCYAIEKWYFSGLLTA